ncbi:DUF4974 domain-containing protein [Pedobacter frigidisoli]|uniref:DUF4974 domain-containing protein n=1 Tax=Pedobacter frigidisoli TaxID=2530455 RepID=A0A4R0NMJ0_9SPHI|nr:FecR domain-containing protein [Pedobacter frigidisoli]TCD00295.1 DUF4974 domain-containing protein [Pedobacter frigidisoli]
MDERDIYLLITRYLQNQTNTEENEILADWITASQENEQTFEEIKLAWQATALPKAVETGGALSRLKVRISEETKEQAHIKKLNPLNWGMVAASIAMISLISIGLLYLFYKQDSSQPVIHVLVTRAGEVKNITLVDGTKISLGPKSSLTYPDTFSSTERGIHLVGQAYFEVSKNPHKPFTVSTAELRVKVLGTHFNVDATRNQVLTTVSLFEGKVEVNPTHDSEDTYTLRPGQELSLDRNNLRVFQRSLDSLNVLGWMTKTLIFRNDKLSEAASKIENMYGVKLIFSDQDTADTRIYAQFNGDALDDVLTIICASGNLRYRKQGNKIYINER